MSELSDRARAVFEGLSPSRRHRLARMLAIEKYYGFERARWMPDGSSQWKMAQALIDDDLILRKSTGGYALTELGALVAKIYEESNANPESE